MTDLAKRAAAGVSTANHVYVLSEEYAWVPARVISTSSGEATVSIPVYKDEQAIATDGGKTAKRFEQLQIKLSDYPNQALPLQNVNEEGILKQVEDMVDLPFLHEAAILYNLKARHVSGLPYTRTGDIVIAVNPYEWLDHLYHEDVRSQYAHALVWDRHEGGDARATVPPHVYETSSLSYRGLAIEGQHQSILVSGESGAGKTETVKILMSHLASVQAGVAQHCHSEFEDDVKQNLQDAFHREVGIGTSPIVQRVLDSNPLLEAFGNAKTVRNDNSSRFGKYIQLQFDAEDPTLAAYSGKSIPSCVLAGSKCEVYLLEKSRVVGHEEEERTYHVFYQLLAAPDEVKKGIWEGLQDTDNESFIYVGWTDTDTIEGKTDAERFQLTTDALALIGVKDEKYLTLMRAMCIVLQLGNLVFEPSEKDDEHSDIASKDELKALADLMGVKEDDIRNSLTLRTVRARGEEYKVPLNTVKAKDSCDAFAKEIYAKSFLWLVRTINDATCAEKNYEGGKTKEFGLIGLLDIFGFESFETNRFEQLCINYTNEKIQQKFTQDIFRSVQAEYEFEGIELGEITYADNLDVLRLVEGRMGLISVLNEECVRPRGNDTAFVSKVLTMNKDSDCLIVEKSFRDYEFGVKHYAGPVIYDATNFVTKNTDTLPPDLLECATKCSNDIIGKELSNESMMNVNKAPSTRKKPARPAPPNRSLSRRPSGILVAETVWTKFRNQLTSLMQNLGETRTRYIRCIKPNTAKRPRIMQHVSTVQQLRCAGVVAAVTISRSAFPNRLEHEIVLDRFKSLWTKGNHRTSSKDMVDEEGPEENVRLDVENLLTHALRNLEIEKEGVVTRAFVIGKSRAYFRAGALELLESERLKGLGVWAVEIERIARGFVKRSQFVKMRSSAIKAAAKMRAFVRRKQFRRLRSACILLQCWSRCSLAAQELVRLRSNHRATQIQTHFRMMVARAMLQRHRRAAMRIQATARGAIQRPKYREELRQKIEEAKLENQLKALQKKLEEAEARRLEAERKAEETAAPVVVYKEAPATEEKNTEVVAAQGEVKPPVEVTTTVENDVESMAARAGELTSQQQTLMDESGKMLEYLRKEVFKLRSQNAQLRTDFDLLKENNQRLMDANASAGASFAALNQHAKLLNKTNEKLVSDNQAYRQQVHKLSVTQVELREELKMKQATYIAEVHSRLQYQKTMEKILNEVQERCRDSRLVEDILTLSDECESQYMNGPTGLDAGPSVRSLFSSPLRTSATLENEESASSLVGRFRSFFS